MKRLIPIIIVLCCGIVRSQQPDPKVTESMLFRSAEQQLQKSTEELAKLRDDISAEKLPLAQELTAAEQQVTQLRRDHDRVTKALDSGNLDLVAIRTEIKARQEELSYVGNLLDEYARTFESKVNVCELQPLTAAIEAAKKATEDPNLSATDKFARQTGFADTSIKRLSKVIGGVRFPGEAVGLDGAVSAGQFAIIGPVALFRPAAGQAGVVMSQSGSNKPLVRPLEGEEQAGLDRLVKDGEGNMPLDPSLGGALKALVTKFNLIATFQKGGPIMWPLLVASILAFGTVIERLLFLMRERLKRSPKAQQLFFEQVERGDLEGAITTSKKTGFFVVRALGYALAHRETSLPNALLYAQAKELKRFRRGIPILDTVITLAPLLGLLGTVTGMMGSFSLISGEIGGTSGITGGIAEALIATACGLGIAITCLLPFNFLNARHEDARHELESASTQLELLLPHASAMIRPTRALSTIQQAAIAGEGA